MSSALNIVQAAQGCLGTPFHHQGRVAGIGLDCIGVVVHALRASGLAVDDRTDYGRQPDGHLLRAALMAHGFYETEDVQAGDVLLFRFNHQPQHVGVAVSGMHMIHAYAPIGRVVETGLGETWRRRIVGIFRLGER